MKMARSNPCVMMLVSGLFLASDSAASAQICRTQTSYTQTSYTVKWRYSNCHPTRTDLLEPPPSGLDEAANPGPGTGPGAAVVITAQPSPEEFRRLLTPGPALDEVAVQRRHLEAALSRGSGRSPRSVPLDMLFPPPEGPFINSSQATQLSPSVATGQQAQLGTGPRPSSLRP
jgi:hypothetical protein